jgi:ATP-dependent DNA ligase
MVHATIWDHIPYMYFTSGECPTPYKERFARLQAADKISIVPNFIVEDIEEAQAKFKEYYDQGEEGIILKDMHAPWENKRSKSLIKFKGELECDLKIVDVEDGTGKYEGMLGALVCESEDGIIKVKVGSGFNDEDRKKIKKQDVVGKVVAVKYNSRIRSKHEGESLFLPIFVEIREDKDKADSSGAIK